MSHRIDRRHALLSMAGTLSFGAFIPATSSRAATRDARFVTIILRGALDGLCAVPPTGDSGFSTLRSSLDTGPVIDLDGFFALHPSLVNFARHYKAGQGLVVHASASPYRERSHFDGQDVLESGLTGPGQTQSGWMNRLLSELPMTQQAKAASGLGIGAVTPLILRGQAPVLGWAPQTLKPADETIAPRLLRLYQQTDPALALSLSEAITTGKIVGSDPKMERVGGGAGDPQTMVVMAKGAAKLMAQADGPRICALAFEGWDTHATETARLARLLTGLDNALAAFESELGPLWKDTAIMVVTEFGRTARVNGTQGTDHGTGAAAFVTGGAVKGGRVLADWPGLSAAQLYENRDLRPTTDIRAVAKGIVGDLFKVTEQSLATKVFPNSETLAPIKGLIV